PRYTLVREEPDIPRGRGPGEENSGSGTKSLVPIPYLCEITYGAALSRSLMALPESTPQCVHALFTHSDRLADRPTSRPTSL
ncbi:hypothetical protein, partial [Propionibacterium freudenreichii]|uniref:hypothetical protein n=1 Tax=Propionibacterium freudenreichii TaxID=1744 RepID=UPI001E42DF1D